MNWDSNFKIYYGLWQNGILFTGGEDKNITAWDTTTGKVSYCIEDAHSARVKGIVVLSKSGGASNDDRSSLQLVSFFFNFLWVSRFIPLLICTIQVYSNKHYWTDNGDSA